MRNLKSEIPNLKLVVSVAEPSSRPAVFLDRDGVINENRNNYVRSWDDVVLLPGALSALARLAQSHYAIVVVTNQSGVGRGLFPLERAHEINRRLVEAIEEGNGRIDVVQMCPHAPEDGCGCRKPMPGLLLQAARALNLDLAHSWIVGDALSDIQAGMTAGVRPLLVRTGRGASQATLMSENGLGHIPVLENISAAVEHILAQ